MTAPLYSAKQIYKTLIETYGPQDWWPGDSPLEIMVGAVLTQNTAWNNVAIAIARLKSSELLTLDALLSDSQEEVKAAIRPAGFHNVKYDRLTALLHFVSTSGGIEGLMRWPTETLGPALLQVKGVGPETADSILLYVFGRPAFVVDKYTRRLLTRLGHAWAGNAPYRVVQDWFVDGLVHDATLYGEYHALIVQHGKAHCRAQPSCSGCPLEEDCPQARSQVTADRAMQPPDQPHV